MDDEHIATIGLVLLTLLLLFGTGCINCNLAWRGQIEVIEQSYRVDNGGTLDNQPKFSKGNDTIDAGKEYTDSFRTQVDPDAVK